MKKLTFSKLLLVAVAILSFASCKEEIDQSNRYTFTGETVADYLQNREDQLSSFTEILKKANLGTTSASNILALLATYGNYTCFAPTNEAIERYLVQQDSIYWANR